MAAPIPDAGIAAMCAERPCATRRWLATQDTASFPNYNFFPWKGQYIDSPPRVAAKWTTDDDVHQ